MGLNPGVMNEQKPKKWNTNSMVQSLSWEANRSSVSQETPDIYGTQRFTNEFTKSYHLSLSWGRSSQSIILFHFLKTHFNAVHQSMPVSSK